MLSFSTAVLASLALASTPAAATSLPEESGLEKLQASVVEHRLDNGWTFLIVPREGAPVVSLHTYIDVGGVFEAPGATGMAHMFEHMAFKGSSRLGTKDWQAEEKALEKVEQAYIDLDKLRASGSPALIKQAEARFTAAQERAARIVDPEAFSKLLEEAGGSQSLNASTSAEETRYIVSLPSNQIELWCWLERERFADPVLREFYKERDAVMEERRMRVESSPFGALLEQLLGTAFTEHPYRRPIIGYAEDLMSFSRTEAEEFYAKNYGVRRFTTAIVGDVNPKTLVPLLERYFGDFEAGPEPTTIQVVEPAQTGERRVDVEFPAMPIVLAAWHIPARSHVDTPALDLGLSILGQAQASRLNEALVRGRGLGAQVGADSGLPGTRHPNLAIAYGIPSAGTSAGELEAGIFEVVKEFQKSGPTSTELSGAKARARASLLRGLANNESLAADLCEWQSKSGTWRNLFGQTESIARVTANDIKRVFTKYFTENNRTVATLIAPKAGEGGL
jgi:predicted Zn-dependent peptidase